MSRPSEHLIAAALFVPLLVFVGVVLVVGHVWAYVSGDKRRVRK